MTTTVSPQLFIILDEEFEVNELMDITLYGMSQGVPGFTYSSDLHDKWTKHKDEITDYLDAYCKDNFNQSMWSYIAEQLSFDDQLWTEQEFIEYAVWMYVECRAFAITTSGDY